VEKEAKYWEERDGKIRCTLCPHNCIIGEGKRGICGVRENRNGKLYTLIYGSCSSAHADPIEKKPLYHFHPGTFVYSLGTVGCNFRCLHCQNYTISQARPEEYPLAEIMPEDAVKRAAECCDGIAFTYNEPTIWMEYALDTAKMAREKNLYTVFVTNGYINREPLDDISRYLDAVNVDVKSMNNSFYRKLCSASLEPVLEACWGYKRRGVHVELTYLVIPSHNDSEEEIKKFCRWVIKEMGELQVIHFTAFYPHYRMMNVPPTSLKKLLGAYTIAKKEGLHYVYLGNVPHGDYENTYCHNCGNLLIERYGFSAKIMDMDGKKCGKCGEEIPVVL